MKKKIELTVQLTILPYSAGGNARKIVLDEISEYEQNFAVPKYILIPKSYLQYPWLWLTFETVELGIFIESE